MSQREGSAWAAGARLCRPVHDDHARRVPRGRGSGRDHRRPVLRHHPEVRLPVRQDDLDESTRLLGCIVVLAGFGVFSGALWARIVGAILGIVSAICGVAWSPYYPIWGIAIIAVAIAVIWALTMHGREVQKLQEVDRAARVIALRRAATDHRTSLNVHPARSPRPRGGEPRAVGARADGVHARVPHHPRAARRVVGVHDADRQLPRRSRSDDADALLLAQRWSKYMAVTFAVGAVTGTVLTFEFGLLWPRFMGRFGDAFGIPFAIEGLFFFLEAIFIAIYIYGWKRLKPWPHFWTGVPIVIAGIGGTVSVVAANAWMNEPSGLHAELGGQGRRRRPVGRDLQQGDAATGAAHARGRVPRRRVPDRVGLRGGDAARPARPLPPARVPHPVHGRRDRARRSRCSSATRSRAGSTTTSR